MKAAVLGVLVYDKLKEKIMKKLFSSLLMLVLATTLCVPAFAAATLDCHGTESGGNGSVNCDPIPHLYAYTLIADINPVTHVFIGTDDGIAANYTNVCMPSGWSFAIVTSADYDHFHNKIAHGVVSPPAIGRCPFYISFTMGGSPIAAGAGFNFGFDHDSPSHNVAWDADGNPTNWVASVGGGAGPVHAPESSIPQDVHATVPGDQPNGSFVEFGTGFIPPIPADFFGPGSDPFADQILLEGDPPDPLNFDDISTVVKRFGEPIAPTAPLGSSGTVDIEIVALNLRSIDPITITYNGGIDPEDWDVYIDLSPTPSPVGQLTATKTHDNGGTFDAGFNVQPRFTFIRVSDQAATTLDTGGMMPPLHFTGTSSWVHSVDPSLNIIAPHDGSFVPGVVENDPGDPFSQQKQKMPANEVSGAARHTVIPATPTTYKGDIDGDGDVDIYDFILLAVDWLKGT